MGNWALGIGHWALGMAWVATNKIRLLSVKSLKSVTKSVAELLLQFVDRTSIYKFAKGFVGRSRSLIYLQHFGDRTGHLCNTHALKNLPPKG